MENKIMQINIALLKKMFEIAGHDFDMELLKNMPDWFVQYTWTLKQEIEFTTWATEYVKKELKCSKEKATKEIDWWLWSYGLKTEHEKPTKK